MEYYSYYAIYIIPGGMCVCIYTYIYVCIYIYIWNII